MTSKKWTIILLLQVSFATCSSGSSASAGPAPTEHDVLVLAQTCVGEAGWYSAETMECAAIVHTMMWVRDNRFPRSTLSTAAYRYSSVFRTNHRPWIEELNFEGTRPRSLGNLSWDWREPLWFGIIAQVREVLRGDVGTPCPGARDWGSVSDGPPSPYSVRVRCDTDFYHPNQPTGYKPNRFWTAGNARGRSVRSIPAALAAGG